MTNPDDQANTITKREYFAAMAMAASSGSIAEVHRKLKKPLDVLPYLAAIWVLMADALIAELNKETK